MASSNIQDVEKYGIPNADAELPIEPRDGERATEDQVKNLRHVADKFEKRVWLALILAMAERFSYYGISAPFQNYVQNARGDVLRPGALGLGQALATNINYAFMTFGFITPVPAAVVADRWLGRYQTICWCIGVELIGCLLLFITSLPSMLDRGAAPGGLAAGMILICIGVGGVKTAVSPFVADQYAETVPRIRIAKGGECIVTDRTLTMQYIYNVYYGMINVGSLAGIATTFLEKEVGFWSAYLLGFCTLWSSLFILIAWRKQFNKCPPSGNILPQALQAMYYAMKSGFIMDAAKPEAQLLAHGRQVHWDERFIEDLKLAFVACKVCLGLPIFWLCWGQAFNNLISQAGQMQSYGLPNDVFKTLNPIGCILFGPVFQLILYPLLNKHKIPFGPIARFTVGFACMAISMTIAAGIQSLVYKTGPCYQSPLKCAASNGGRLPNNVNVFLQTPSYVMMAFAEIFTLATSYEYAYTKAPQSMKSVVQALSVFMAAIGSALGIAIAPADHDPNLTTVYAVLAGVMAINASIFWWNFKPLDNIDEDLNKAVVDGDELQTAERFPTRDSPPADMKSQAQR